MTAFNHTVPVSQVRAILQGARHQGLNIDRILAQVGLSTSVLNSTHARVSQTQYASLLKNLQRLMRDEYWGLCQRPIRLGTFSQCCHIMVRCHTLGEALRAGAHFYHLLLDDFVMRVRREGDLATVSISSKAPGSARLDYAERVFGFFTFGLASWLIERRLPLRQVLQRGPEPGSWGGDSSRLFQAPVHFDQAQSGFSFDASWLDQPVRQDETSAREFLQHAPGNLLEKYKDQTRVTERVRRHVRQHLADGPLPFEDVAELLNMTPQTLRRRLRHEGERYQSLKDDVRRDTAIEYLVRADFSLLEIAERLGFSEPSTFHRAFKKWTGLAPGEYRQTVLLKQRAGNLSIAYSKAG